MRQACALAARAHVRDEPKPHRVRGTVGVRVDVEKPPTRLRNVHLGQVGGGG